MAQIYALNLGCGNDYRESTDKIQWVNVDNGECKKDLFLDIENLPFNPFVRYENLPFLQDITCRINSDLFDEIHAIQVLEHIERNNFVGIIRELYRISKNGCVWNIAVPHAFSDNYITDPTHKMPYSTRTFDYFCDGEKLRENGIIYGWGDIKLSHVVPPVVDGNQSIIFTLQVLKENI